MAKKRTQKADPAALADEVAELEALVKRRKKAEAALEALENGEPDDDDAPAQLPGAELIDQVMGDLGGEGSFSIVKLEGGKTMDMGTHDLTLWPDAMEELVKVQGGGNYVLIFRRPDGTIAKRIKRTYPASLYPSPAAPVAASSGSGDMIAMIKIMEDRAARQELANENLRLEAMKSQQSMMTAMIAMMTAQNKPMVNNVGEIATIAKLFQSEKKGTDLSDLVALKDLLDDLRGDPEEAGVHVQTDNPWVAMLAPILGALGKNLNAMKTAPKSAVQPAAASPAPAIAQAPQVTPSPAPTAVPSPAAEGPGLMEYAQALKTAIDAGATPDLAAEKAWEDARERHQVVKMLDLIENGDWAALEATPALVPHAAWIASFRSELRKIADAESSQPAEPVETAGVA